MNKIIDLHKYLHKQDSNYCIAVHQINSYLAVLWELRTVHFHAFIVLLEENKSMHH